MVCLADKLVVEVAQVNRVEVLAEVEVAVRLVVIVVARVNPVQGLVEAVVRAVVQNRDLNLRQVVVGDLNQK